MGHRIELGEIETAVSSLEDVTMNCCLYDEKHSKIVLFLDLITKKSVIMLILRKSGKFTQKVNDLFTIKQTA